jgi:transketolase
VRTALLDELTTLAASDPRIVLIVNDVGFSVVEPFQRRFPERFINAGVAEANMIGVAAGLALTGYRVFVYAIAPFTTYRCLEQIRLDLCRTKLPVTLVGLGGGFTYGQLGTTHHPTEDVAMLRALPGMRVLAPCDALETRALIPYLGTGEGPIYLRLEKAGQQNVHAAPPAVGPGCSVRLREGDDVTLIAYGTMVQVSLATAERLASRGVSAGVISAVSLKPLDPVLTDELRLRPVVTVEEHSTIGGLGSALAEAAADAGVPAPRLRIGVADSYAEVAGDQTYLRSLAGLTADGIEARVADALGRDA